MDTVEARSAAPDFAAAPQIEEKNLEQDNIVEAQRPVDPKERSLLVTYNAMVQVAPFLQMWYERFDRDRKYVNEECLLIDDEDVVSTNYILRNQVVLLANLFAREPAISWKPGAIIGEHPPLLGQYGKTLEIFCKKMAEETELKRLVRAAIQDASTIGWQVMKLSPQEDPKLDPIGTRRHNDQLDNIARYQWLKKRKAAGQFPDDSPVSMEIADLEKVVIAYARDQLHADMINNPAAQVPMIDPMTGQPQADPVTGEPMTQEDMSDPRHAHLAAIEAGQFPEDYDVGEIARYIGFNLDPIQAEDFRFDWTVTQPERMYDAEWIAHRVFMSYDQFGSKFDVSPEEIGQIILFGSDGRQIGTDKRWTKAGQTSASWYDNEGPSDRKTMETNSNMGRTSVWEMWHRGNGRVYVWAEGMQRFLMNDAPTIVGRRWYPFYMLGFNRVTGRVLPLSDTTLTRQLQDELNRRRTLEAEAQKASFPRIFIKQGSLLPGEKEKIENSQPYEVIEIQSVEDVNKAFAETKPLPFNPELYRRDETRMEMEMMSGISKNAAGSGEGDLATSAAIANEQMGVQTDYRRSLLEEFIYDIMYDYAYMGNQFIPEENIKKLCGNGAYWPMLEREQFLRYLKLDIRAGSTGRPDAEKNLATIEKFANIAVALGLPVDPEAILEDMMYDMGKPDWKKYLMTPEKMAQRAMMGIPYQVPGGGGGAPGPTAPRGNAAESEPTPGSGSPTMADKGPPSPGSVPGPKG
jgi:hypothetical protein